MNFMAILTMDCHFTRVHELHKNLFYTYNVFGIPSRYGIHDKIVILEKI